jgi:succinate-semialdehyde dehydrogenase / glutarate-semialdehyde dehydrogenase
MLMFVNGQNLASSNGAVMFVIDKFTGDKFDTVPQATSTDVDHAFKSAAAAFALWKNTPLATRARIQKSCAVAMREHAPELAALLTRELGRPLPGCLTEFARAADLLDVYADEGLKLPFTEVASEDDTGKVVVSREPIGVVAAITPFNAPINLLIFKLGAAVMAGCTMVAKPADDTPLSTLRLAQIFHAAGLPAGVFNVVTGDRRVGEMLVAHPTPRKVAFTGSIPAGKAIAAAAAGTMKRVTLELGGQSPATICADADLEHAAIAICRHAFANSGQICYRAAKVYVERAAYADFVARLTTRVKALTMCPAGGSGDLGPMVNERMLQNPLRHIADARALGCHILSGGERLHGKGFDGGYYLPPTLIADVTEHALIMREETFGPVLAVAPVENIDEAITNANATPFGLAAFVFTRDAVKGQSICNQLEAGSVWLNDIQRSAHLAPFGGVKQSGLGREKGRWGIEAYLEWKTTYLGPASAKAGAA